MIQRGFHFAAVVCAAFVGGCNTSPRPSGDGGNSSADQSAAIVGQIVASAKSADLLAAQATGDACPVVEVSINGAPVTIEFDDNCSFLIDDVQPAALVTVRVELVDLGVAGSVELSDVAEGELIEILVELTDESLTVSVARRSTPVSTNGLPEVIDENDVSIQLPAGVFDQGLTVNGNNFMLVGEAGDACTNGTDWTVITGEVFINGNDATFRNILFAGPVELHGNGAHFINCCFGDVLIVFGNDADVGDDDDDDADTNGGDDDGDDDDGDDDDSDTNGGDDDDDDDEDDDGDDDGGGDDDD